MSLRRLPTFSPFGLAAVFALCPPPAAVFGCREFCDSSVVPLSQRVAEADLVLYGDASNARRLVTTVPGEPAGQTDLKVLRVLKDHPARGGANQIVLPVFNPYAQDAVLRSIVFLAVLEDKNAETGESRTRLLPFFGVPVENDKLVDYLEKAAPYRDKPAEERLAYFFQYLDDPDSEVSRDAFNEFAVTDFADEVKAKAAFDPNLLLDWIRDPLTPPNRIGLYGGLLGICGTQEHAEAIRKLVDDRHKQGVTGLDGLLAGYCLLLPQDGPQYVIELMNRPDSKYGTLLNALRTIRFLLNKAPQIDRQRLLSGLLDLLANEGIADMVVKELVIQQHWEALPRILAMADSKAFEVRLIRKEVFRYALTCPAPEAKAFLEQARSKWPLEVQDMQEVIRLEQQVEEATKAALAKPASAEAKAASDAAAAP